jgi:O-antigen/teichoic acid export membrane protein
VLSFPLGWAGTLACLNANIPRYFLQHYSGLADQGVYSSLAYLVIAMGLIVLALSQSVATRLAQLFAEGEIRKFVRLLLRLSMLGVLISVVGSPLALLVGRPFLTLVYRSEYGNHANLLALLVGASGITTIAAFLLCGMNAARLFDAQFPLYAATVAVCALSAAVLVPRFGLVGAGGAVLISSSITVLGCTWVMRHILKAGLFTEI